MSSPQTISYNDVIAIYEAPPSFTNFQETCTNITLDGTTLTADCLVQTERFQKSSIDLNIYIGNQDGRLRVQDSKFDKTSSDIVLVDGHLLMAKCTRKNKTQYISALDLNDYIGNIKGQLTFVPFMPKN